MQTSSKPPEPSTEPEGTGDLLSLPPLHELSTKSHTSMRRKSANEIKYKKHDQGANPKIYIKLSRARESLQEQRATSAFKQSLILECEGLLVGANWIQLSVF